MEYISSAHQESNPDEEKIKAKHSMKGQSGKKEEQQEDQKK